MGHRNPRPEYGDGGSLKYRRDELLKIAHPVSDALLQSYPFKGWIYRLMQLYRRLLGEMQATPHGYLARHIPA